LRLEIRRIAVDTDIKSKLVPRMGAFFSAAGDADSLTSLDLGDLPDSCPNRASRRSGDNGFTGFRFADIQQAAIGRAARHTHDARRPRRMRRVGSNVGDPNAIGDRVILPAIRTKHPIPNIKPVDV